MSKSVWHQTAAKGIPNPSSSVSSEEETDPFFHRINFLLVWISYIKHEKMQQASTNPGTRGKMGNREGGGQLF